jgi:hypothetical protein
MTRLSDHFGVAREQRDVAWRLTALQPAVALACTDLDAPMVYDTRFRNLNAAS